MELPKHLDAQQEQRLQDAGIFSFSPLFSWMPSRNSGFKMPVFFSLFSPLIFQGCPADTAASRCWYFFLFGHFFRHAHQEQWLQDTSIFVPSFFCRDAQQTQRLQNAGIFSSFFPFFQGMPSRQSGFEMPVCTSLYLFNMYIHVFIHHIISIITIITFFIFSYYISLSFFILFPCRK